MPGSLFLTRSSFPPPRRMTFEHFALNVPDARAHVQWYVQHLGLTIARQRTDAPYTHFLADDSGRVIVELYSNPVAPFPDYAAAPPLVFHIAFVAADARAERVRLEARGRDLRRGGCAPRRLRARHDARPVGRSAATLPARDSVCFRLSCIRGRRNTLAVPAETRALR